MASRSTPRITLELRGERAKLGIDLDSLERFIEHFRAALRDFERSATAREYQIGRGGHPDAISIAATSFRLIGYRTGSAILEIAETGTDDDKALKVLTEGPATQNLKHLFDSIDAGAALDSAVVDDLDEARKAIGETGNFQVRIPNRAAAGVVDAPTITKLRDATASRPSPGRMTVYGRMHLIATEGTRVEIRATDGYNWACTYSSELEPQILRLIKKQVRATGRGVRERANRGTLEIETIEALPEYEQTALFSARPVAVGDLEREQGIEGPQGLRSLSIEDLPDDDAIDRYLATILED